MKRQIVASKVTSNLCREERSEDGIKESNEEVREAEQDYCDPLFLAHAEEIGGRLAVVVFFFVVFDSRVDLDGGGKGRTHGGRGSVHAQ